MPLQSPFSPLDIPKVNLLTYIFPPGQELSDKPLWIDSKDEKNSLSMKQLHKWCKRIAIGLDRLGVAPGSVVMIYTPSHILVPAAYLGVVGSGRIFSGANPAYTRQEVLYQLQNTQTTLFFVHPSLFKQGVAAAREAGLSNDQIFQFSDSFNSAVDGIKDWSYMVGSEEEAESYKIREFTPKEATTTVAAINYSSGTTGVPKGVCITHHNLISNVTQATFAVYHKRPHGPHDGPPERWIGTLPLYHAFGQLFHINIAAKLRVPVYVLGSFVLNDFLRTIQNRRITNLQVVPPILVMLSKRPEVANFDISSVRDVISGAAPLSKELQNDVATRFGMQVNQAWGMTETTCGAIHMPGGIRDESGSVGQLYPNTEAKLLDEDGKEVGPGERGELFIRGPQVCKGYWRNKAATDEVLDDEGWLRTGDVAVFNRDELFWIVDRKKELIKVNGFQVAPAELEAVLLTHPHIADAAVVGVNLDSEEFPRAYVVPKGNAPQSVTEAGIEQWMRERIAKHKFLTGGVLFVPEIPKLGSGKIVRKVMREWAKRDAGALQKKLQEKKAGRRARL